MNAVTNESYPLNLLDEIAEGHWEYPLPEDIKQSLAYVLAELKEREQVVLHAYFCEGKSCGEIAKTAGVVRDRIRQIVINALKKLRHPTRMQFLIYGVKGMIHKTSLEATQNTVSSRFEIYLS